MRYPRGMAIIKPMIRPGIISLMVTMLWRSKRPSAKTIKNCSHTSRGLGKINAG